MMAIDDKLSLWQSRHARARRLVWPLLHFFYNAEGFGPNKLEGPALVFFDKHNFSIDGLMAAYFESYTAMVARRDRTLLSLLAHSGGGPTFDERGSAHVYLFRQLRFLLAERQVVALFPFTDVHNSKPSHVVVKATVKWEKEGKIPQVSYIAATTAYSSRLYLSGQPNRMWPSYWPVPFLTSAKILASDTPIFFARLPEEKRSPEGLIEVLREESAGLRAKYFLNWSF